MTRTPSLALTWWNAWLRHRRAHRNITSVRCLDLRQPRNVDTVRRLPQPELRRYIVACNLTYTKECSAAGTVDPRTGIERYAEPPHCTIRDKHGKIVRTYTTDALRP